jgi:acyl-coenzyme A thioesterase PaaI-like protein
MALSIGAELLSLWRRLHTRPGGVWLFNQRLARMVPYTGTVSPRIVELRPGYARAEMRDRRRVRNHLRSIHAVALINVAEVVGGLAMLTALPDGYRGIVVSISMQYLKKARGTLTAESLIELPPLENETRLTLHSTVRDRDNEVVARATVEWLVRHKPPPTSDPRPPT